MAEGAYAPAASLFAELGEDAAVRGGPRAPQFTLQAGRAWILAGETAQGYDRLKQGLTLMAETGQIARLPAVASRVLEEMQGRGLSSEAQALRAHLDKLVPGVDIPAHPPRPAWLATTNARRLPPKCPYCGGNVNPESVDWLNESSAACEYCGSTLQAEGTGRAS
jgi:hypothetical protein